MTPSKSKHLDGIALCKAVRAAGGDHLVVKACGRALLFCDEAYLKKVLQLTSNLLVVAKTGYKWVPSTITGTLSALDDCLSEGFEYVLEDVNKNVDRFYCTMARLSLNEEPAPPIQTYTPEEFNGPAIVQAAKEAKAECFIVRQGSIAQLYGTKAYLQRLKEAK